MFNISSFLTRFKSIGQQDILVREKAAELISVLLKVRLDRSALKVKDGTLLIEIHPIKKNEILMRRGELLAEIKQKLPECRITNIR